MSPLGPGDEAAIREVVLRELRGSDLSVLVRQLQGAAVVSPESLRVVRGSVNANGSIAAGAGFTVSKPSTGHYTVSIAPLFPDRPSVVVSAYGNVAGAGNTATLDFAILPFVGGFGVLTASPGSAAYIDLAFDFVAVGPR